MRTLTTVPTVSAAVAEAVPLFASMLTAGIDVAVLDRATAASSFTRPWEAC
jgi:hypothetical protein